MDFEASRGGYRKPPLGLAGFGSEGGGFLYLYELIDTKHLWTFLIEKETIPVW